MRKPRCLLGVSPAWGRGLPSGSSRSGPAYAYSTCGATRPGSDRSLRERGWEIVATEDAGTFSDEALSGLDVSAWLMTRGDVLNQLQEYAFERFLASGKGYVGAPPRRIPRVTALVWQTRWRLLHVLIENSRNLYRWKHGTQVRGLTNSQERALL